MDTSELIVTTLPAPMADEARADDAPADNAPADNAPADDAPADDAPADDAPADDAPADDAPADDAPADDAPRRRGRPPAGGREAILAAALQLLRERGIARVTSREVAALAGVSEASVFYHYKDRTGLLQAVFEQGLQPLKALASERGLAGVGLHDVLTRFAGTLDQFLDQALPVMAAAQ